MTIADKARAHHLWSDYVLARDVGDSEAANAASHAIAVDLGLTERQRVSNLPKAAAQRGTRGRPRKRPRCPHCGK